MPNYNITKTIWYDYNITITIIISSFYVFQIFFNHNEYLKNIYFVELLLDI